MINVTEENDGSLTITWDPYDPIESMLNDWTEEDFIQCMINTTKEVIQERETKCEQQLQQIADDLGGTLTKQICVSKNVEHKQFVIEYDRKKR